MGQGASAPCEVQGRGGPGGVQGQRPCLRPAGQKGFAHLPPRAFRGLSDSAETARPTTRERPNPHSYSSARKQSLPFPVNQQESTQPPLHCTTIPQDMQTSHPRANRSHHPPTSQKKGGTRPSSDTALLAYLSCRKPCRSMEPSSWRSTPLNSRDTKSSAVICSPEAFVLDTPSQ